MNRIQSFLIALFVFQVFCFGKAGGEITYKYIGNNQYDVYFKLYRDCREQAESKSTINFMLFCPSTSATVSLSPTLVSIRDISSTCRTAKKCDPSNTQISTSTPIFEEHTYKYTLDFNGNEASFKSCCLLKLYMYGCCRSGKISTGPKYYSLYIVSDLNLCSIKGNSSPVFLSTPTMFVGINQPAYLSFGAKDTVDNDSLSYQFTQPLYGLTSFVKWDSGFSYNSPLTVYWPNGYNRNKGPNPNVNPPIGLFLDPETGQFIFTPTDTLITVICIAVKEWRKDSTGKYKQIGEISREVNLIVKYAPDNNPPLLYGPYKYDFCAGSQICFTITSDDKQFIPPPPKKPAPPDTVTLSWTGGNMKGATYTIVDPKERLKKVKFCWTPKESDVSDIPYSFSITAKDNSCPMSSVTTKTYLVKVKPSAKAKVTIKHIATNKKNFESQLIQPFKGTPQYFWQVLDSVQQPLTTDYYFFKQTKTITSSRNNDSVIFRKAGKYLVYHRINNPPNNCPSIYYDTITIPKVIDVSFFKTKDTSVCKGAILNFKAIVVNGTPPYLYKWGKGNQDTLNQVMLKVLKDTTLELEATDANGLTAYCWVNVKLKTPLVDAGLNKIICKGDSTLLIAVSNKFSGPVSWSWFLNGKKMGSQNSLKVSDIGYYSAVATDSTGCFSKDSVLLKNFFSPAIVLMDSSYCQAKGALSQFELIKNPNTINLYKNVQWQLLKSLKNPKGLDNTLTDLLADLDTTAKYNFSVAFDKSRINLGTKNKDSLIFSILVTDSNKCKATDTAVIVIKKSPTLNFKYQKKMFCGNEVVGLDSLVNHDGDSLRWTKVNETGYSNYPATGEVKAGIISPSDFNKQGGFYKINALSKIGDCETKGSMDLDVIPMPIPTIDKKEFKDSVRFTDKSLFRTSHFWYLDTAFISNDISITLAKKAADGKSITLKLKNGNCNVDTVFLFKTVAVKFLNSNLIKIYPNPATQTLTIETTNTKPFQIKVFNAVGQIVLTKQLNSSSETIEVNSLSQGVYTLEIAANEIISRMRFLKE